MLNKVIEFGSKIQDMCGDYVASHFDEYIVVTMVFLIILWAIVYFSDKFNDYSMVYYIVWIVVTFAETLLEFYVIKITSREILSFGAFIGSMLALLASPFVIIIGNLIRKLMELEPIE